VDGRARVTTDEERVLRGPRRLERYQFMEIGRLIGIKEFEGERENSVLNTFIDFKPVKRFEDRSSMSESEGSDNSTCERVLDQLESM